jgi:hypothetical protein
MKNVLVNFQVDDLKKRELELKARHKGLSLSEFLRRAADLYANFDLDFFESFTARAREYGVSESFILQNAYASWVAQKRADVNSGGSFYAEPILPEFSFTEAGPLKFQKTVERLEKLYSERKDLDNEELLSAKEKAGILSANERRFLEEYRKRRSEAEEKS